MRDNGICSNCGGEEIVQIKTSVWNRGYNYIYIGMFTYLYPTKYICTDCGYMEQYIEKRKHLDMLKRKFPIIKNDSDHIV